MPKRLACIISGRVQGVTYRDFTARVARRLGLAGFVRNLSDGSVEAVAEGEEEKLLEFLRALKEEHPFAVVEAISESWSSPTGEFKEFRVAGRGFF